MSRYFLYYRGQYMHVWFSIILFTQTEKISFLGTKNRAIFHWSDIWRYSVVRLLGKKNIRKVLLYVIYIIVTYYIAEACDCFIVIGVTNHAQTYDGLTWHAGNLRLFPLATWQAFNDRIHFLEKILFTVVSHFGVCLVTQPLFPKHLGMGNMGGLTTGGCWKPLWVLDLYSFFFFFFLEKEFKKEGIRGD